jgi:uncharacterized membrane protein YbaN (DUF454 family)
MQPITLQFTQERADYEAFIRHYTTKGRGRRSFWIIGLLVLGVGVMNVALSRQPIGTTLLFTLLPIALFLAFFAFFYRFLLRRNLSKTLEASPQFWEKRTVTITDEGLVINGETFNTDYTWKGITQLEETKDVFLLYSSPVTAVLLPKRAFSPEQLTEFRNLVKL